jgi:hypothetical protein
MQLSGCVRSPRVIDSRSPSADVFHCTTRQQNAHITDTRELLYRWHCWYGQPVYIFGTVTRGAEVFLRCALDRGESGRLLEVPQWMFEATACCRMVLAATASVSVRTLRDLTRLMRAVSPDEVGVLQGKHPTLPDSGGAREKPKPSTQAVDHVSSSAADAAVAQHAHRSTRTSAKIAGATVARTSPRSSRRATYRKGGAR